MRSGSSTLAAELDLVRGYVDLVTALDRTGPRWRLIVNGALPPIAFPRVWLLPLMDALAPTAGDAPLDLRVHADRAGRMTIALDAPPGAAPDAELRFRLEVALRTTFGDGWELRIADASDRRADDPGVVLGLAIPSPRPPYEPPSSGDDLQPAGAEAVVLPLRAASLHRPAPAGLSADADSSFSGATP